MKKNRMYGLFIISIVSLFLLAACSEGEKESGMDGEKEKKIDYLTIATGGTQGTYYSLGGALADFISKDTGIKTTASVSQASAANVTALTEKSAEIAFIQTDIAYYATNGEMMFDKKIDSFSAIGSLYPETIQLVTLESSGIKTFEDLKGKKVSVGAPGSGTYANAMQLLEIHGLSEDDIKPQNLDFGESEESLQAGQIDAAFITGGVPIGAVDSLNAKAKVNIVPVSEEKADELISKYEYYAKDVIPKGTYGLEEDVPTVAVGAMLVVQNELPEDLVYEITKSVYENASKLQHAKGKLINAETGLDGIGIPVHPGAQKYFDEVKQ